MLSLARNCSSRLIFPKTRHIINNNIKNAFTNGIRHESRKSSPLVNRFKLLKYVRGSATIAIRLSSDATIKYKKAVGYWLLGCSGMVFVAVVLGIIAIYYVVLIVVLIVVNEAVKITKTK